MIAIELECKKCGEKFDVPLFSGMICTHCGHDNQLKKKEKKYFISIKDLID
jgi:rRNA maturation endonuclease Nob1